MFLSLHKNTSKNIVIFTLADRATELNIVLKFGCFEIRMHLQVTEINYNLL